MGDLSGTSVSSIRSIALVMAIGVGEDEVSLTVSTSVEYVDKSAELSRGYMEVLADHHTDTLYSGGIYTKRSIL